MFKNFNSVAPQRFLLSRSALGATERGKTDTSAEWRSMKRTTFLRNVLLCSKFWIDSF